MGALLEHAKPAALVDVGTFWDPVTRLLTELTLTGSMPEATARNLVRVSGAAEFLGCCADSVGFG